MVTKERFGKFILLEEIDSTALGSEYRAAKLGPSGFEKIVSVERLRPALAANAEVAKSLLDQVKTAAQIQNPNVVKIFGIGKIDSAYYIAYEFLEGKSLKAVFKRCRQEGFPFSVDHALLIASKACSALEQAHARKSDKGVRYFHGLVTPDNVVVTYEGEVRVRGFGYWPSRVREVGGVAESDRQYLAPEQVAGAFGDTRSDTFAVGALLYEMLTGQPLFPDGRDGDLAARVGRAKLWNPTTDDDGLPKPIAEILRRSLAADPAARYAEIQEMRKAVDTLLFSGDFTPTTFNLAFFMHSLFRDDIERESRRLKEERDASYAEPGPEDTPTPPLVPAAMTPAPPLASIPAPASPRAAVATAATTAGPSSSPPLPLIPPPPRNAPIRAEPHPAPAHPPAAPAHADSGASSTTKESAAGFTFHEKEHGKKKPPALMAGGIAAVVLLAAIGGWLVMRRSAPATAAATAPPSTLSAEAQAAMQRVKELEEKLKAIENEKAAAEARAAEEAKKRLEAQAAARGQKVDSAAVERAQDEARRRAQAEQDRKAQEERKRLEDEQKAAEARVAEERRRAEAEAARAAAPPTTLAEAPPVVKAGALVNLSDAGVIAPVTQSAPALRYPPIAERQRVEGIVELNILVDEKGNVVEALLVTPAGGKSGLNEAAVDNVKRRRYRPATRDGVPVKVWFPVSVRFVLPR
jgi:TonB family protein